MLTEDKFLELQNTIMDADQEPDLIAILEVRPKKKRYDWTISHYHLRGYSVEALNTDKEVGRGMLLYVKDGLSYTLRCMGEEVTEVQTLVLRLKDGKELLFCSAYRSPNSSNENNEKFNNLIRRCGLECKDYAIFMGDMNYPGIDWDLMTNRSLNMDKEFHFVEAVKDSYFVQHVDRPTRGRGTHRPSLLDLVLTDITCPQPQIEYAAPLGRSDHSLLKVTLDINPAVQDFNTKRFNYIKGDYGKFRRKLQQADWQTILEEEDHVEGEDHVEEMWRKIKEIVVMAERESVPLKKLRKGKVRFPIPLDHQTRTMIKRKKRLWRRVMQGEENAKPEFNRLRNKVRRATRRKKRDLEKEIANQVKSNPKRFWSYANQRTHHREPIPNLSKSGQVSRNDFTESNQEKVDTLGSFFSSVFTEEEEGRWEIPTDPNVEDITEEPDVSEGNLRKIMKQIRPGKSPGPDAIHPRLLVEGRDEMALPLSKLFAKSLETGCLPADWKLANVTAIYKKGDKRLPSNYRPVSLTSTVCKLMEKTVRDALVNHMKQSNLLSKRQYGFISGRSTLLQLLTVLEKWTKALDDGDEVDVAFLDFAKAFDKVPHGRLMDVLEHYGIKGQILRWIKEFLKNRQMRVCLQGHSSEWMRVTSGVPQGSVIGPVLFVIYINSLPDVTHDSQVFLFADDTKIFKQIISPEAESQQQLQSDLQRMHRWTQDSLLRFNADKCCTMTLSRKKKQEYRTYLLGDQQMRVVETEKDLGVVLDSQLYFENHMLEKIKKANSVMGVIRRSYTYLEDKTFLLLYKALVRPHLEYCNQVWCPRLQKHTNIIENVQRRATRMIPGMRDKTYEERLRQLKLPTLHYRRKRGDMIEIYKILNHYDPAVTRGLLTMSDRTSRGHSHKLEKPRANTNIRKDFFTHRTIDTWNKLPQDVISADSVIIFERRLDQHWKEDQSKYQYSMRTNQFY